VLAEKFIIQHKTCHLCPVVCEKICEVKEGEYKGSLSEGFEYETLFAFGPVCGNSSFESIITAGMLCDHYGLDTLSTGVTIAFAMECFERGLLTKADTGGLELRFGNHKALVELVHQIGTRRDFGNVLAEGSKRVGLQIGKGAENYSMQVKGLELAGWDPRTLPAMSIAYGTSNRGACHTTAAVFPVEIPSLSRKYGQLLPAPDRTYEQFSTKGKADLVKFVQDNRAAMSAVGGCYFARPLSLDHYGEFYKALTDLDMDKKGLMRIGERIYNMEKAFNVSAGMTRQDDWLPDRFYTEAPTKGPNKGKVLSRSDYNFMLDEYYALRGWNKEGKPTKARFEELGLTGDVEKAVD
jgi:aldehyde:ferredoxin oxidoreductase